MMVGVEECPKRPFDGLHQLLTIERSTIPTLDCMTTAAALALLAL